MELQTPLTLTPSLNRIAAGERLKLLLVSGELNDPDLVRRAHRLELLFRSALLSSPVPLWAPELHIEREWRTLTETFLPWREIAPALRRLISRSLRYLPPSDPLAPSPSWPDFLQRCSPVTASANPALLLRKLATNENLRHRWLFTLFLPKEHGNGFDRYPGQQLFLRSWLARRRSESDALLSCLDAACGSGEGSWDLATLCSECGYLPHQVTIHGSSLDPLELFAAAHAFFPHDSQREEEYRKRIAPVIKGGFGERLRFIQEDLADSRSQPERYDLILCNGLLGGPMLHDPLRLSGVVRGLVRRLKAGGLFLAADRFHEGWQKRIPQQEREALLEQCGVKIVQVGEGIGGKQEAKAIDN